MNKRRLIGSTHSSWGFSYRSRTRLLACVSFRQAFISYNEGWTSTLVLIWRSPAPVVEPHRISNPRITILISMPSVVGMRSILDLKDGVAKACFSESWVARLWLCHTAYTIDVRKSINKKWKFEYSRRQLPGISYLVARPSRFPPSPMVIYTGADSSFTGWHLPFTIL